MHILEAPRNKPLSNGSFGPATMVDYVKYYVRASSTVSTVSAVLELTVGIDEFWRILCSNARIRGHLHFNKMSTLTLKC